MATTRKERAKAVLDMLMTLPASDQAEAYMTLRRLAMRARARAARKGK